MRGVANGGIMKDSVIARGIDTLVIGYSMKGELNPAIADILTISKDLAQDPEIGKGEFPVDLFEQKFIILPKGSKGHEWILQNDDISLAIGKDFQEGKIMPEMIVTYRSSFLWRNGVEKCTKSIHNLLSKFGEIVSDKVSRVDIATDLKENLPEVLLTDGSIQGRMRNKSNFVGAVKGFGQQHTGYMLGSGSIVARVYDKLQEIQVSKKEWFKPIWEKGGWREEMPVTRVEFQFRRDALQEFSIDTVNSLLETLPDLWHYATHKWFTMHDKKLTDTRRSRWPLMEFWKIVQSTCFLFGTLTGVQRYRQVKPRIEHLFSMTKGALTSSAGLIMNSRQEFSQIKDLIYKELTSIIESPEFETEANCRQAKFASVSC